MTRDYAAPDWRGLCEELAQIEDALSGRAVMLANQGQLMDGSSAFANFRHIANRARAALAQPEPEVPVPAAVGEAAHIRRMCDIILGNTFGNEELDSLALLVGHHPDVLNASPPPVEGEVAELVALIRQIALAWEPDACLLGNMTAGQLARAADLLEQRQAAPVPVSERLPGAEDCDAEGRCWWWYPPVPEQNYGYWIYEDNAVPERSKLEWPDSWLPFHALPLPQGEVQP